MDFSESTTIVLDRIKQIEPDFAPKIMGYIMMNHTEREMIRLAFGPDKLMQDKIQEAKVGLSKMSKQATSAAPLSLTINPAVPVSDIPLQYARFPTRLARSFSSQAAFRVPSSAYDWGSQLPSDQEAMLNSDYVSMGYPDSAAEDYRIQNQGQFLNYDDQLDLASCGGGGVGGYPDDHYFPDGAIGSLNANARGGSMRLSEFPVKTRHYFNKGFCKHGSNCRYLHGHSVHENFSPLLGPNDFSGDEHIFSPASLEKLETEISDLLKSRRGSPVSIASLPMLYYEKYGRTLQAEGYLTESQRHGRAGYSLTKLLARLKGIRLIDRAHGQHSVILAEDAAKFEPDHNHDDRKDPGPIVNGSQQIYLTFPAESTFSEEDVSDYFSTFGTVEDVRIPCQQNRMFGFVTFSSPDTVKMVLAKGNPHFVCGARVLVKPYREKSKPIERKYMDKHDGYYSFVDSESEFRPAIKHGYSVRRGCDAPRFLRRQLEERALELQWRRLSELQLVRNAVSSQPYLNYDINATEEQLNYLLDALNINGSTNDDRQRNLATNYYDQESQGVNLPESPFASAVASSISTVM